MFFFTSWAFAISATVNPGDDVGSVLSGLGPGDIITFNAGLYELEGTLRVDDALGEESNPVRLEAAEGADVVIQNLGGGNVLEVRNSSWVDVSGLTFQGGPLWMEEGGGGVAANNTTGFTFTGNTVREVRGDLLRFGGDTVGATVRDNRLEFTSRGTGLYVGCGDGSCWMSDSVIEHNLIHDVGTEEDRRSGLILDNGCQGNQVVDNVFYNITGLGLRVESTQNGPENVVEGNALFNIGQNGLEVVGEALVRNNVVVEVGGIGIRLANHENDDLQNVRVTYNTVALCDQECVRIDDWNDKEGMVFSSNAIANINGRAFRYGGDPEGTTNRMIGNVISGFVEGVDESIYTDWYTPGGGTADFEDVENWDLRPTFGSRLAGNGDPASESWVPSIDFQGRARNGASPSVGAMEFTADAGDTWLIREDFKGEGGVVFLPTGTTGGGCGSDDSQQAVLAWPVLFLFLLRRKAMASRT